MKKKLSIFAVLFAALFITIEAEASEARVVGVEPIYRYHTTYHTETTYQEQCNIAKRTDRGWIERGNNNVFGSIEGTIGTAVGYGIGNEIGGGSGNEIAKVVGAILGNKIGNDIGDRNRINKGHTNCYTVPVTHKVPTQEQRLSHYNVTVDINNQLFVVKRNFEPRVGQWIDVSLSVR